MQLHINDACPVYWWIPKQNTLHEKYYTTYIYTSESKSMKEWQRIWDHDWWVITHL